MTASPFPAMTLTNHSLLHDPASANSEVFLGQGSFAVVKLKLFRGIPVAVKELQPRTLLADSATLSHFLTVFV